MKENDQVTLTLLLIEGDEAAGEIVERQLRLQYPNIRLETARRPDIAIAMLQDREYDIVVCSSFLAINEKVRLAEKLCSLEERGSVLMLTAHPDLRKETLPPGLCVRAVLHKPLDLDVLLKEIDKVATDIVNKK